jgi:hypothetical protein
MDEDITFRVSTDLPQGPVMLAERGGEPVAAMSIADGRMLTDPHRVSSWVLTVLRLRRLETKAIISVFGA